MSAYENPGLIQGDKSGQIYGQAMANFGAQFLSFAQNYVARQDAFAKEQAAENARIQEIGYEIEEAAYNKANENYLELQKTDPSLAEQMKTQTATLLNGVGNPGDENYKMGAIKAQTILKTQGNLSKEKRQELRTIVQNAKAFQDRMLQGGSDIMADLEDMDNIKPQDIGNTHYYVGNTLQERLTSQYSAAVLKNQPPPGATTSKALRSDENGMPIVSVTTEFDAESDAGKQLLQKFPELKDQIKDGKISFNWERSVDDLGDGFIKKIPEGTNIDQTFMDVGAANEKGLTRQMMVGTPQSKRVASGAAGVDNLQTIQYINTPGLNSDPAFNATVKSKMEGLISLDPGEVRAYIKNTLKQGSNFDYAGFAKMSSDQKVQVLVDLEKKRLIETKLTEYPSRIATEEDAAYLNANSKMLSGEGTAEKVIPGQTKIYYQETIDRIGEYKGGDQDDKNKNVLDKEKWEGFKESGYRKGDYLYQWDQAKGAFVEYKLSTIDGRETKAKTGNVAKSPQQMGNLTNQNWNNYRGFEPASPVTPEPTEPETEEDRRRREQINRENDRELNRLNT